MLKLVKKWRLRRAALRCVMRPRDPPSQDPCKECMRAREQTRLTIAADAEAGEEVKAAACCAALRHAPERSPSRELYEERMRARGQMRLPTTADAEAEAGHAVDGVADDERVYQHASMHARMPRACMRASASGAPPNSAAAAAAAAAVSAGADASLLVLVRVADSRQAGGVRRNCMACMGGPTPELDVAAEMDGARLQPRTNDLRGR
jgi:hypothetical protein